MQRNFINVRNEEKPTLYSVSVILIKEHKQDKPSGCKNVESLP
jgi:hypothetical protein